MVGEGVLLVKTALLLILNSRQSLLFFHGLLFWFIADDAHVFEFLDALFHVRTDVRAKAELPSFQAGASGLHALNAVVKVEIL